MTKGIDQSARARIAFALFALGMGFALGVAFASTMDQRTPTPSTPVVETLVCVAFGVPISVRATDVRYDDGLWTYRLLDAQGKPGNRVRTNMICAANTVQP